MAASIDYKFQERKSKRKQTIQINQDISSTELHRDKSGHGVTGCKQCNDGNFERGPIAEKGTVFVELNFCKSDQLVNDISYFATASVRLA